MGRRKITKRRAPVDSDEEVDDVKPDSLHISSTSQKHRQHFKRSRTSEPAGEGVVDDNDVDEEVDVDGSLDIEDTRFLPELDSRESSSSNHISPHNATIQAKGAKKSKGSVPVAKKKRTIVWSDDEEDEYKFDEYTQPDSAHSASIDNGDELDTGLKRAGGSVKQKVAPKVKGSKRETQSTGSKGVKGKTKDILMKDERKAAPPFGAGSAAQENAPTTGTKRPRPKELRNDASPSPEAGTDSAFNVDAESTVIEGAETAKEATPPPLPKKRKLPTIKKNKPSVSAGPATPSQPSVPSKPSTTPAVGKTIDESNKLPPPATGVRKPAATIGSADFDLRKPSVYAELFKTVRSLLAK